jgi:hypothetical protein
MAPMKGKTMGQGGMMGQSSMMGAMEWYTL